jgi:hypothetical protein
LEREQADTTKLRGVQEMKYHKVVRGVLSFGSRELRSLFGVTYGMQMCRGDVMLLEHVLSQSPGCRTILEFGSGSGLQTVYLGMAMLFRQGVVHAFNTRRPPYSTFCSPNVMFHIKDEPLVAALVTDTPVVAIIDGGDRMARIRQVADVLPEDSNITIHDWIERKYPEFTQQAAVYLEARGWSRVWVAEAGALCSRFAVWQKVASEEEGDHGGAWCDEENGGTVDVSEA